MTTLYDHSTTPPTAYLIPAGHSCVVIRGMSVPAGNPPEGVYPDGGSGPVPAGQRATAWARVARDGLSVNVPTLEPIPLAELKAAAIEANRAECRARILAAWPEDKQRSAALGVYPPAECLDCADWIASHVAAENAAADLIDAAQDAAGVAAVEVVWPE